MTLDPPGDPTPGAALERMDRLAKRARLVLLWERLWPRLAAILCLAGVFVSVSWLGLWLELPREGRIVGFALFGAAFVALVARAALVPRPSPQDGLARLDRDSGEGHRPASGLHDNLANAADDPTTRALWQIHRRRLIAASRMVKLAAPSPRLVEQDRYALRAGVLVALVASAFIAGPETYVRIAALLDWRSDAADKGFRIDAWIDPPIYTGKPPILLPTHGEKTADSEAGKPFSVHAPVKSTLVVRSAGVDDLQIKVAGGLVAPDAHHEGQTAGSVAAAASATLPSAAVNADASEKHWVLKRDGTLTLTRGGRPIATFAIGAIPERPPTIALTDPPGVNVRGSLTLNYKIDDDYGVASAEATFSNPEINGKPITGHTLVDPPKVPLALPSAPGGLGRGQTIADLSDSPWGGAHVTMVLTAIDDGGNSGRSEPTELTLPQHPFTKALAKALAEQRRNLVLTPAERGRVTAALEGLMIAPELFTPQSGIYLGLVGADAELQRAKTDDDLRSVADYLWQMALQIEDGNLTDAERQLRNAEQNLRDALQRGASEEEIRKLTQDLRAALDKYLNELAQRQPPQDQKEHSARSNRSVTPRDLQSMLDRMDEMAKSGDLADAQQMLDQLQSLLENLQNAERGDPSDQTSEEMDKSLDDLDKMTRDQQQLRDDTFRNGQKDRHERQARRQREAQPPSPGAQDEPGQPGEQDQAEDGDDDNADQGLDPNDAQGLKQRQDQLQQQLQQLRRKLKQFGMKDEKGLEEAEGAMGEAGQNLGKGADGKAVDAQGRALEALRRGAQGMAQQMAEQEGQNGQGNGQPGDGPGARGNRQSRRDPLDRPSRYDNHLPRSGLLNMTPGAAQRAQQVLEELRRRLGEPARPQEELDYLGRLLRRY